ncbi:MAG: hypothetical protein ABSG56_11255 [Bryobacteraceae bacterium]|jgi:hypothetical protein
MPRTHRTTAILKRGGPPCGAAQIDMLAFVQFLEELSTDHVTLSPAEVRRMRRRFGDKTLQMGHLEEDGALSIPVDSIVEAVRSQGSQRLNEALENLKSEQMISMLESADALVERIAEAQRRKLGQMVDQFQREPDDARAHRQWKEIEKTVFGIEYPD